jgi:glycosyltransferase involved in cell wall biosynthesis
MDVEPRRHGVMNPPLKTPSVVVVGPMLGGHSGYVPFVGEALGARLAAQGYPVVLTSAHRQRLWRLADITSTLLRHADRFDVQILQVYGGLSFVGEDVASWLGRRFGQKIIMHLHGGAMPEFVADHPIWARRVLSRASAIVAPSPFLGRLVGSMGFTDVRVIPNAIDLDRYPWTHRPSVAPRLFWMRTFHPVYNPEMAIRVFAHVRRLHPDATLVMAGQDKGTEAATRRLARASGVEAGIRFPGFLNPTEKLREGANADIFLNTNRVDNTPVSVIEAAAMGLPVVATNVGGIADLLTDAETALLVPDNDDRAMAEAVLKLIAQPPLASHLSVSGRRMAEQFSWERTQARWEALLDELMGSPGRRSHPQRGAAADSEGTPP